MKKFFKYFAGAAALAAAFSCSPYGEYKVVPFVTVGAGSVNVDENVGTVTIPVYAYNLKSDCTVAFEISGDAKKGEDFTVQGSEVLNFGPDKKEGALVINVVEHPDFYTGNKTINIKLASLPEGVEAGAKTSCTITVVDLDIPLDWNFLTGPKGELKWTAQDFLGGAPDSDPYDVYLVKVDEKTIGLYNLWDGGEMITGSIDFETKSIAFPAMQNVMDASAYGYGKLLLLGLTDAGKWSTTTPVQATFSAAGVELGDWNMVITAGEYSGYLWDDGYTTKITK